MNRCSKTGLTDKNFKTILDVLNVFDPNDIAHVYPEMGEPEFTQDVTQAFKAVLAHVERTKYRKAREGLTCLSMVPFHLNHIAWRLVQEL